MFLHKCDFIYLHDLIDLANDLVEAMYSISTFFSQQKSGIPN